MNLTIKERKRNIVKLDEAGFYLIIHKDNDQKEDLIFFSDDSRTIIFIDNDFSEIDVDGDSELDEYIILEKVTDKIKIEV